MCDGPLEKVLSTDLANHFTALGSFRSEISSCGVRMQEVRDTKSQGSLESVLSMMLKCADVGHGAKIQEQHLQWTSRIAAEFFNQGDQERDAGIAVSPLCDRGGAFHKSQLGFFEYIVLPP